MSYQILTSPSSINDIFSTLASELIANGYTVERITEVVGAETCLSWTDGSGIYFHLDYNARTGNTGTVGIDLSSSISSGYASGITGRSQVGAVENYPKPNANYSPYKIIHTFSQTRKTLIVVTDEIVFIKQGGDTLSNHSVIFNKANIFGIGKNWICSRSYGRRTGQYDYYCSCMNEYYRIAYSISTHPNIASSRFIYVDNGIPKKTGSIFSSYTFSRKYDTQAFPYGNFYQENIFNIAQNNSYYSTMGIPLTMYFADESTGVNHPFCDVNDGVLIGRKDFLIENEEITINSKKYIVCFDTENYTFLIRFE